VTETEFSIQIL